MIETWLLPPGSGCNGCCGGGSTGKPHPESQDGICQARALQYASSDLKEMKTQGQVVLADQKYRDRPVFAFLGSGLLTIIPKDLPMVRKTLFLWVGKIRGQSQQQEWLDIRRVLPQVAALPMRASPAAAPGDALHLRMIPANGPPKVLYTLTDEAPDGIWISSPGFDLSEFAGQQIRLELATEIVSADPPIFVVGGIELNSDPPTIHHGYLPLIHI
jgi:hypothetical protein